jgi:transposase
MKTENNSKLKLKNQVKELLAKVEELTLANKLLQEQIDWLKKQLFGRKSERFIGEDPNVLYLPGFPPSVEVKPPEEETVSIPAHEKRKAKSTPINTISCPEDLPVESQVLDLSEKEKNGVDGKPLVCIGEEVTRRLAYRSGSYFIKEIIRKKYVAPNLPEEGVKTPFLPDAIIPRCAVDESVLADIIVKKFCDHLPLYRQAEMMLRNGIKISRATLSSYVVKIGMALKPLCELMEEEIKASQNIFVDETPVDILAPGTGKTTQGYMVVMVGGESSDPPLRVYKFFTSRKHEGFAELFQNYIGRFHSDKYGAYEKEAKKPDKEWCPCLGHSRRKYVDAEEDLEFRKSILVDIQLLFQIEERGKLLPPEKLVQLRNLEAVPIIDGLIQKNKDRVKKPLLPKSNLGKAIGYFLSLEPYLKNYINHPYARPDNNVAERALKLVVIGRKNWLFVGSEGGGEAAAIIYSLAQSARALGINPYDYFEDVLRRIQGHPYNQLSELLPHRWKKQ